MKREQVAKKFGLTGLTKELFLGYNGNKNGTLPWEIRNAYAAENLGSKELRRYKKAVKHVADHSYSPAVGEKTYNWLARTEKRKQRKEKRSQATRWGKAYMKSIVDDIKGHLKYNKKGDLETAAYGAGAALFLLGAGGNFQDKHGKALEEFKKPKSQVVREIPEKVFYTVKKGDYLSTISQDFGLGIEGYKQLYHDNKDKIKDPDLIYPNQVFVINNPKKIPQGSVLVPVKNKRLEKLSQRIKKIRKSYDQTALEVEELQSQVDSLGSEIEDLKKDEEATKIQPPELKPFKKKRPTFKPERGFMRMEASSQGFYGPEGQDGRGKVALTFYPLYKDGQYQEGSGFDLMVRSGTGFFDPNEIQLRKGVALGSVYLSAGAGAASRNLDNLGYYFIEPGVGLDIGRIEAFASGQWLSDNEPGFLRGSGNIDLGKGVEVFGGGIWHPNDRDLEQYIGLSKKFGPVNLGLGFVIETRDSAGNPLKNLLFLKAGLNK